MALLLSMASLEAPYTVLELFAHTCVYNLTAYQNTVLDHAADNAICTMHEPPAELLLKHFCQAFTKRQPRIHLG